MTTLYYSPGACSLAVHIALEWIGAPYEAVKSQIGSEELKAVNPNGSVPVLQEDDGWVLTQAGAILDYLAQKHPEAGLSGGGSLRQKAEAHRWSSFFTSDVHAAFWPVFMPFRYTTDESAEARARVKEAGQVIAGKQFAALNAHLKGREWILESRSVIDAYAFPMIRWARAMLPGGLADFPEVQRLYDKLAADPAVQKVLAREGGK
ncbi:glutathione S-transferase family protein [Falsigemmobacter faecalis]|uniref:Glutathione S-transferase family protein n=1 Tax=Falsigemmobacter faecalis TaxID=2488730 RepID=A0A3P3DV49_9RHOB|nr:glutathione S-transferase family protein [Falsigemmobacter faecalis]RRH78110.1 glutathione S-transferase family protein [Falsigemmobacter faecalis]